MKNAKNWPRANAATSPTTSPTMDAVNAPLAAFRIAWAFER
jgi:hypothetical protein